MSKIISSSGRYLITAPQNYKGKKYINNRYVFQYRYIMEQKIGRLLKCYEIVHHINGNKLDDRIENLELMINKYHNSFHNQKRIAPKIEIICPQCGKHKLIYGRIFRHRNKKKQRIFCSRQCSGKFNSNMYWNK